MEKLQITCEHCGKAFLSRIAVGPFMAVDSCIETCPHCEKQTRSSSVLNADFQFSKASAIQFRAVEVSTREIKRVHDAFARNILRVLSLANAPITVMQNWLLWVGWNKPSLTTRNQNVDLSNRMWESMPPIDGLFERVPNRGAFVAIESMLSSMIVGMWTAFETLAGDLWEEALNVNHEWASLRGDVKRIIRASCSGNSHEPIPVDQKKQIEAKEVPLRELERISRGTYDLSHLMGTLHRESGRFNFATLAGIRMAYGAAVHENSKTIDELLTSEALDALSGVRNLIVHRAGIADEKYSATVKRVQSAPQLEKGQELELNGELVRSLVQSTIDASVGLLKAVDARLVVLT